LAETRATAIRVSTFDQKVLMKQHLPLRMMKPRRAVNFAIVDDYGL
jgi:hypothetical protein